jgi:hypothetical protein
MTALWLGGVAALLVCCKDPPKPPQPTPAPTPTALMTEKELCVSGPEEDHGPQGRLTRGGCLEPFLYVAAAPGAEKPSQLGELPSKVRGYHWPDLGMYDLRVERAGGDACVVDHDRKPVDGRPIPLYRVFAKTSDKGEIDLCKGTTYTPTEQRCDHEAADLEGKAMAVPGYWDAHGVHQLKDGQGQDVFTVACVSGAAAKCVHWGYVPWVTRGGTKLDAHHEACVLAARARYLDNDDHAFTCDGNVIDTFDNLGIRTRGTDPKLKFEAAWGASGLVCAARSRYLHCEAEVMSKLPADKRCKDGYDGGDPWPSGALLMNLSDPSKQTSNGTCPKFQSSCP